MLPAAARLRTAQEFTQVTRSGRRSGGKHLVVHLGRDTGTVDSRPRAGFVVSKKVGNAVTRNRVTRRLRALIREKLTSLDADVVVRALPSAAGASSAELGADLNAALCRAARRGDQP